MLLTSGVLSWALARPRLPASSSRHVHGRSIGAVLFRSKGTRSGIYGRGISKPRSMWRGRTGEMIVKCLCAQREAVDLELRAQSRSGGGGKSEEGGGRDVWPLLVPKPTGGAELGFPDSCATVSSRPPPGPPRVSLPPCLRRPLPAALPGMSAKPAGLFSQRASSRAYSCDETSICLSNTILPPNAQNSYI